MSRALHRSVLLAALLTFATVGAAALAAQSDSTRPTTGGAPAPSPPAVDSALERRVNQVSANLRCPVCQGLSILDSPAELAQDMKRLVREQLAAGRSQLEIEQYFIGRYGEWVLLKPRGRGANLTVWLLPALLIGGGAVLLWFAVQRWVRRSVAMPDGSPAVPVIVSGTTVELTARRDSLRRTLAELDDDFADDKITKADYEALRLRDEAELLALRDALKGARTAERKPGARAAAGQAVPTRRLNPALTWTAGVAVFGAVAVLSLKGATKPRSADGSITGIQFEGGGEASQPAAPPIDTARLAELERAVARDSNNQPALIELGHLYLKQQRLQPAAAVSMKAVQLRPHAKETAEAWAHMGMILWGANELDAGLQSVDQALELSPDLPEALLFRGLILFAGKNDPAAAVGSWERYLQVAPPGAETDRVRGMLQAARQATP